MANDIILYHLIYINIKGNYMRKSITYTSIGVSVFLLLATLSSVVGYSMSSSQTPQVISPLFAVRTARSINDSIPMIIHSEYLGKGKNINIFQEPQIPYECYLDAALKILFTHPSVAKTIIVKISESPQVHRMLSTYGLRLSEVEQYFSQIMDNPQRVHAQLKDVRGSLVFGDLPQPSDLSTASIIGCFVVLLALLPLAVLVGLLVATITIVTCLNIGGCAEAIIQAILVGISQELIQP